MKKRGKLKVMKGIIMKYLIYFLILVMFLSCSSEEKKVENTNNKVSVPWQYKINFIDFKIYEGNFYFLMKDCILIKMGKDKMNIWEKDFTNAETSQICNCLSVDATYISIGGGSKTDFNGDIQELIQANILILDLNGNLIENKRFQTSYIHNETIIYIENMKYGHFIKIYGEYAIYSGIVTVVNFTQISSFNIDIFYAGVNYNDSYYIIGFSKKDNKIKVVRFKYIEEWDGYKINKMYLFENEDIILYNDIKIYNNYLYMAGKSTANIGGFNQGYYDLIITKLTEDLTFIKHMQFGGSGEDTNPFIVETPEGLALVSSTDSEELGSNGYMDISIITLSNELIIDSTSILSIGDDIEFLDAVYDEGLYIVGSVIDGSEFISLIE